MLLILFSDIWEIYFINQTKINKNEIDLYRSNIIENPLNTFVFSKNSIDLLENLFDSNHPAYNNFRSFLTEIIDSNARLEMVPSDNTSQNIIEECNHLINNCRKDVLSMGLAENYIAELKNFICLNQVKPTNKHWILVKLAGYGNLSVSSADFKNNDEIQNFFSNLFRLYSKLNEIYIFNRYCDLKANFLYDELRQLDGIIYYHTQSFELGNFDNVNKLLRHNKHLLSSFFKNVRLFHTSKKNNIHERKVVFEDIVIHTDHDFNQIKKEDYTWAINVHYSKKLRLQTIARTTYFNEFV